MIPTKHFWDEYDLLYFDSRFRRYIPTTRDKQDIISNGYMVPLNSSQYIPKHIIIGVIENNSIAYYKAIKKK